MSNETEITGTDNTVLENPALVEQTTAVEAPPEPAELRYEYQPTDEQGRPIGGLQVIKYKTPEELATKLVDQNVLLVRKLRTETRKNRLGINELDTIEEDAPRFTESVSFAPKSLTPEDRVRISRDLLDPDRFDEASDELFTAKLGVSPTELTRTISELQHDRLQQKAIAEANAFAAANQDYVVCPENAQAITGWLLRYGLAPVKANFQRAYDKLKNDGILVVNTPPVVAEEVAITEPVVPTLSEPEPVHTVDTPPEPEPALEPVVAPVETPAPVSRVPLSLSRSNTDESGAPPAVSGSDIVYEVKVGDGVRKFTGLAAVDAMSADEYRRRVLSDPNFAKKVEKLEADRAAARKQRR